MPLYLSSVLNASLRRKGLYPLKSFPAVLGLEASGVIVGLPTDEKVLNDEYYKRRGYKIGDRVALVRPGNHL